MDGGCVFLFNENLSYFLTTHVSHVIIKVMVLNPYMNNFHVFPRTNLQSAISHKLKGENCKDKQNSLDVVVTVA